MARIFEYRFGTAPNYQYILKYDTESAPSTDAVIVRVFDEATIAIKQFSKSNGHYTMEGVAFVAAGGIGTITRKNIYTVPNFTRGVDLMNGYIYSDANKAGDRLNNVKILVGKIGTVISADSNTKTVTVRSQKTVLTPSAKGGKIDEGFYVSFGTETYSETTPLSCYMILRISEPISVDTTTEDVTLTLNTFPAEAPSLGTDMNLSVYFVSKPIEMGGGEQIGLGDETLDGSAVPAGTVIQVEYERIQLTPVDVRGHLVILY